VTDIVERLRAGFEPTDRSSILLSRSIETLSQAADEIEQLRESCERAMLALDKVVARLYEVESLRINAEAERGRLRVALEKIAARVDRLTGGLTYTEKATRDIARAALGETGHG
jgi:hypothetical protein